MKLIPLLTKDDFELARARSSNCLWQNVECHSIPTQTDSVDDSPINHALTAVAQEVAELLRQAYPSQANGIDVHSDDCNAKEQNDCF